MKEIIMNTLADICTTSHTINSESGREEIANKILKAFSDNHIVFYTNLEEKRNSENTIERGL